MAGQPLCHLQPYQVESVTSVEANYIPSHQWHQAVDAMVLHMQQTEELLNIVPIATNESAIAAIFGLVDSEVWASSQIRAAN